MTCNVPFMSGIICGVRREVHLIMGDFRIHRYEPVKVWLEEYADCVEGVCLLSYSPELNSDACPDGALERATVIGKPRRSREKLPGETVSYMQMALSTLERVKDYFKDGYALCTAHSDI